MDAKRAPMEKSRDMGGIGPIMDAAAWAKALFPEGLHDSSAQVS
jgi:hypothetical protein